jgi:hypothetical protein
MLLLVDLSEVITFPQIEQLNKSSTAVTKPLACFFLKKQSCFTICYCKKKLRNENISSVPKINAIEE